MESGIHYACAVYDLFDHWFSRAAAVPYFPPTFLAHNRMSLPLFSSLLMSLLRVMIQRYLPAQMGEFPHLLEHRFWFSFSHAFKTDLTHFSARKLPA